MVKSVKILLIMPFFLKPWFELRIYLVFLAIHVSGVLNIYISLSNLLSSRKCVLLTSLFISQRPISIYSYNFHFLVSVCLRLQVNPQNQKDFVGISPERGFADFIFAHVILHLVVVNFIGWILNKMYRRSLSIYIWCLWLHKLMMLYYNKSQ